MNSGFVMLVVGIALLLAGYLTLPRTLSSREIAVVASLGALSAAGRVAFAAVPSVQPSTVLVIVSGWVLGPSAGFVVGGTTALVSNVFLGQGPWTVWQMLSWAFIGMAAGWLGSLPAKRPVRRIVVFSVISGFAFGWAMDVWFWLSFVYPHTVASLLLALGAGLWMDVMHAVGNAAFAIVFAGRAVELLRRFKARMHVTYVDAQRAEPEVSHA
jgi:energy-coupling factor transport system substrate-specific component